MLAEPRDHVEVPRVRRRVLLADDILDDLDALLGEILTVADDR